MYRGDRDSFGDRIFEVSLNKFETNLNFGVASELWLVSNYITQQSSREKYTLANMLSLEERANHIRMRIRYQGTNLISDRWINCKVYSAVELNIVSSSRNHIEFG